MDSIDQRIAFLRSRLQSSYDGLGQSSGRPYLYFVYPPEEEARVRRLLDEQLAVLPSMQTIRVDLLTLTVDALHGEEERRQHLLTSTNPVESDVAPKEIAGLWQRRLRRHILRELETVAPSARPLVLLEGLASLHPLTTPTAVMEKFAEQSIDNPHTGKPVPIVLFVPGVLVPHSSRVYHFLVPNSPQLLMYRGEDV